MADKMVIIPEAIYRHRDEDIERRKSVYPTLERIEDDIDYTLTNHNLTNYEKAKLLGQLQQRYKGIYASKEPIKIKVEEATPAQVPANVFSEIVNTLPKANKKKAAQILSTIKASDGALDWDANRRIVIDGVPIDNSNIVQLVKAYVSKSKDKTPPPSWEIFSALMLNLDTPIRTSKKAPRKQSLNLNPAIHLPREAPRSLYRRKTYATAPKTFQWQEEN